MKTFNLVIILTIVIVITSFISFSLGMGAAFRVCAEEARKFVDVDTKLIMEYLQMYRSRTGWYGGLSNGTVE